MNTGRLRKTLPVAPASAVIGADGRLDVDALLAFHRSVHGDARMEETPEEKTAREAREAAAAAGGGQGGNDRTFTQADMNATAARVEAATKAKAEQDIATALGVTVDEAKTIIAERRASDDAKKTQAERDAAAAETAKNDAERIKTEAARDRHDARVERILGQAGLDTGNETLRLAGLAAVKLDVGADEAAVKAAVEQVKKDAPQLFGAASNGGGTHSDAGGQRRDSNAPAGEFGSKGAEEAARRWGTKETAKTG